MGRPNDGYSSTSFPPPFYDPSPRSTKRKYDKTSIKKAKKTDSGKENRIKLLPSPPKEKTLSPLPPPPSPPTHVIIPGSCTHCHTTNTPLWRRGPFGYRT